MFSHRVLPPPSALTASPVGGSRPAGRDTLLQHRIMTAEEPKDINLVDRSTSPNLSQKASSPLGNRHPSSPGQESLEDYEESPSIESLSSYTARKRSSSQISREGGPHLERGLQSISNSAATSFLRGADAASQVCLCQPDPKVPRPRNAFILYRQHHQAAVVAQNPGLANPQISKIIGDHWRSSPPEIKNHWRILAEEEKLRHQRQYPDYRYQPRRSGRSNSAANAVLGGLSSNIPETRQCVKCGGRSITTPGMSTPSLSIPATPMTPYTPSLPPQTPATGSSAGRFLRLMGSPPVQQSTGFRPRLGTSGGDMGSLQLVTSRETRREDADSPMSPDAKRRRFGNGAYGPVRAGNGQLTPFPFPSRRESLPRPEFMPKGQFMMAAPPRPHHPGATHPDSSLTLPPLKTSSASEVSVQAKSVEAMVMSIPQVNKIKVLAKISPPLGPPGPASPTQAIRGGIVAIDGADSEAVRMVMSYLSDFLSRDNEHTIRIWESPALSKSNSGATFAQYLSLVNQWHTLSDEIIKYVTTIPTPASPSPISPKTMPRQQIKAFSSGKALENDDNDGHNAVNLELSSRTSKSMPTKSTSPRSSTSTSYPIPIAILPHYQLSQTDNAASIVPITDAYAPIDHWQWMATLWRGIVGSDITIVVKSADGNANVNSSPKEETLRTGAGVEVRLADARTVIVRVDAEGRASEGGLRRVGFEVGEWIRSLGERSGRRAS